MVFQEQTDGLANGGVIIYNENFDVMSNGHVLSFLCSPYCRAARARQIGFSVCCCENPVAGWCKQRDDVSARDLARHMTGIRCLVGSIGTYTGG